MCFKRDALEGRGGAIDGEERHNQSGIGLSVCARSPARSLTHSLYETKQAAGR